MTAWKNLWDYFFNLAEQKMLNDLLVDDDLGDYGNCFISVTKPYLTTVEETTTNVQLQNKHLTLMSSYSHSSGNSSSTNYSTSTSSATSSTPPFPKLLKNGQKNQHEFEFYVFSSINICNLCNTPFKSSMFFFSILSIPLNFY